ncbi:hypothetical protein F5B20DRAFT_589958 [Whalleya microplaca]|nr:hypothetical protein F5B20DRAFT_589958 [Whalleya microplaca]
MYCETINWKALALLLVPCTVQASLYVNPVARGNLKLPSSGWNTSVSAVPSGILRAPISSSTSLSLSKSLRHSSSSSVSLSTPSSSSSSLLSTSSFSASLSSSSSLSSSKSGPAGQTIMTQSTTEAFSLTAVTSFPDYSAPTTTITGDAETSSVIAIAPLFTTVWKNRGNLLDPKTKEQYIEDVTNTKNQLETLYNNLADKSDPPAECSNTSGGRSLISGIKNVLTTPAKLISCAAKVVGNLVNAVNAVDLVISIVETLTNTLQDIGNELEKSQDDNPTTSDKPTSTGIYHGSGKLRRDEVKTITTMVCATISGCSARATTATTTVSTATTSSGTGWICDSTCAAGGCAINRRATQPTATSDSGLDTHGLEKRNLKPTNAISDSIAEGLDWTRGIAVSKYYQFLSKAIIRYVTGVTGCTSIMIISEKGVWVSHFMETGFMDDEGRQTERSSLNDAVQNGNGNYIKPSDLAGNGGDLNKSSQNVQDYVLGPCTYTTDESGNKACHGADDVPTWEYDRINTLLNTLFGPGTPFEGVTITKRGYIKPVDRDEVDSLADTSARGKVVVQYDPNQFTHEFRPYDPKHAAYRVWLESSPYQRDWVASSCQGGNAPNQKRDDSCPISGSDRATVTSQTASSSQTTTNSKMVVSETMTTSPAIIPEKSITSVAPSQTKTSSLVLTTISTIVTSSEASDPDIISIVTFSSLTATMIS